MDLFEVLLVPSAVLMFLLVVVNICIGCWWVRSANLGKMCGAVARACRSRRCPEAEDPEVKEQVAKLVWGRRLKCSVIMRIFLQSAGSLYCCKLIADVNEGHVENRPAVVAVSLVVLTATVGGLLPRGWFARYGRVPLHIVGMFSLGIVVSTKADSGEQFVGAMMMGAFCLRFELLFVTNVAMSIGILLACSFSDGTAEDINGRRVFEVIAVICRLALLYTAEALLKYGARKDVAAEVGKCQQSAVSALLDRMCDAVVDLDRELRLRTHVPKLAHMLLHGDGKSLQGVSIMEFIGDETDRNSFEAVALQSQQGSGEASGGMFNTRLRDSMGNLVKVLVFLVPYVTVGGNVHHLVGLREDSDPWEAPVPAEVQVRTEPGMPEAILRPHIATKIGAELASETFEPTLSHGGSVRSWGRTSLSSWGSNASLNGGRGYGEWEKPDRHMSATVALCETLPVKIMGRSLRKQLGLAAHDKSDLGEFLPDNGAWLLARLRDAVQRAVDEDLPGTVTERIGELELASQRRGAQGPIRQMTFMQLRWPPDRQVREVQVGFSSGRHAKTLVGRGTAAAKNPQALLGTDAAAPRDVMAL